MSSYLFVKNMFKAIGYKVLALLLILLLMPTAIFAKGISNDWNDVKQLPKGLPILIKFVKKYKIEGVLKDVSEDSVTVILPNSQETMYPKYDIKEVHEVIAPPGKRIKYTLIGAGVGLGVGLASATPPVIESTNDEFDGLIFLLYGGLGAASGAAVGGIIDLIRGSMPKTKKIYQVK